MYEEIFDVFNLTQLNLIVFFIVLSIVSFLAYKVVRYISKRFNKVGRSDGRIKGYVYIISNPSFKDNIYKIGMTERTVPQRIKELFTTGVPTPFVVELKVAHKNPKKLEDYLHVRLSKYRVNKRREFFQVSLTKIRSELNHLDLL